MYHPSFSAFVGSKFEISFAAQLIFSLLLKAGTEGTGRGVRLKAVSVDWSFSQSARITVEFQLYSQDQRAVGALFVVVASGVHEESILSIGQTACSMRKERCTN